MTALGIALQILAVLTALIAMGLVLWTTLPLVTEWPAQWLGIVEGLERSVVAEAVKGTSAGQNAAESSEVVFMTSPSGPGGDLMLSQVRQ